MTQRGNCLIGYLVNWVSDWGSPEIWHLQQSMNDVRCIINRLVSLSVSLLSRSGETKEKKDRGAVLY